MTDNTELLAQVEEHLGVNPALLLDTAVVVNWPGNPLHGEEALFLGVDCEGDDRPMCYVRTRSSDKHPFVAAIHRLHCSFISVVPRRESGGLTDLERLAERCDMLRTSALFNPDFGALGALSEQHFLLAISALDQAQRHASIAAVHLATEIASDYRRRG